MLAVPRGCALSWSLAFMPNFAPELTASQYQVYRDKWFVHIAGTTGVREWPVGHEGGMDADSGFVVGGIGAAASGFGIAAAKINGDRENFAGMLRGMELLGFSYWNVRGEKHYFGGKVLLTDVLALWGKTNRVWDEKATVTTQYPPTENSGFWKLILVASLVSLTLTVLLAGWVNRKFRSLMKNPNRWQPLCRNVFLFDVAVVLAWIFLPWISWLGALFLMAVAGVVQNFLLRASASEK